MARSMQASTKRIPYIFLLVAVALILLLLRHTHRSSSDKQSLEQDKAPTALKYAAGLNPSDSEEPRGPRRDSVTGEVIWKVGSPKPILPAIRGENRQRQFGRPITRELPAVIENSLPAVLAMIPADGRQELLAEETDVDTLHSRRMVLDTEALDRILTGQTNHLLAPTPGSEVLDLKVETILTRSAQTHSFRGKIAEEELSSFSIVYHDGIIHGSVSRYEDNRHFEYRILADGHMMVREIDMTTLVERCGNTEAQNAHECGPGCKHAEGDVVTVETPDINGAESPVTPGVESDTAGWTTIDVVVGYGAQARSSEGGTSQMEARIINSIDDMNAALVNSLVSNTEMMLLGTIEDPAYVFPGSNSSSLGDELDDLDNHTDGKLDTVSDYSNLLGADLTAFICNQSQGGTAGLAQRPGRSSVTARTALSPSLTFSHELGHNLGAKHSLGDGTNDDVLTTPRYGLRFEGSGGGLYRTIMAYNNGPSYSASRIPHYANPSVNYDGTPTGAGDGSDFGNNAHPLFGLVDPVYETLGYDGTNSQLGARNAQMFLIQEGSNGVVHASNRTSRTALGITSPLAAATWPAGSTQTISFTGGDMEYTADIDLYKGGAYQFTIANDIEAIDHSYSWNIPLAQPGGNDFKIRVTLTHKDTMATSFAESGFFVIQGTTDIVLQSPIGGESWTRNTVQNITWSSSYGGNVKIEYIKGAAAPVTIINSTPDDGSYGWTVPHDFTLGSDYQIRITSDVSPFDTTQSAANFTIVAPGNNLLVTNLDSDPGFTTSGEFEYGAPAAGNGASSPNTGTNMYDTNLADTSFGASSLTTYAIDCSNHTNITLEFWAYIMVWTDYSVKWEVSNDNSNWTTLETIGTGVTLNQSWTNYTYDITSYAAGQPTVYVRWSMNGSGTQMTAGGLSIDDISITGDFIPADSVNLLSPNGSESIIANTQSHIQWVSSMDGNVMIELLKNNSLNATISSSTANDGSFYWTPPASQTAGNDYKIRISKVGDTARNDVSDANFSIIASPTASSVPYSEGFESGLGAWSQSTSDTLDWSRDSGGTPSNGTGPTTGSNSSTWYLYTEASNGNENKVAEITNWFDLRATAVPEITFHYHMFGINTGTISLQASTDGATWTTLFEESGTNQDLWKSTTVGLAAYAGKFVQLKFSGATGPWWESDMAIDDISIDESATTTYTISYNANASISGNTPSNQIKGQNIDLTLADAGTMIRSGYTCTGWNTASDGSGTDYPLAGTYTTNSNLTLYAQWTFTPYLVWAGEGVPYNSDSNGDGVSNGLAWLLGASGPTSSLAGKLPNPASSSSNLIVNFDCLNAANRGAAVMRLQYSNDLGISDPWSSHTILVPDSSSTVGGVSFVITPNGAMNEVQATIPSSEASAGRIFSRLTTDSP